MADTPIKSTLFARFEKLRRNARAAAIANPLTLNPLMAPTAYANSTQYYRSNVIRVGSDLYVCSAAGITAATGTGPSLKTGVSQTDGTAAFRYLGKARTTTDDPDVPVILSSGNTSLRYSRYFQFASGKFDTGQKPDINGNGGVGHAFGPNIVTFDVISDVVAIECNNSNVGWRLIIDGRQMLDGSLTVNPAGSNGWNTRIQFPDNRRRRITFESDSAYLNGVSVPTYGRIVKPDSADKVVAVVLGSSIEAGAAEGPFTNTDAYMRRVCHMLGWNSPALFPRGGTGYLAVGGGAQTYRDMFTGYAPDTADVVFLGGPYNDQATDVGNAHAAVKAEAKTLYTQIRAKYPNALITVSGCWNDDSGPSANLISVENAVFSAVDEMNDPLMFKIPLMTDPDGPWVDGTGRLGSENSSGNSDILTGADSTHPTVFAHYRYLPARYASAIREFVLSLGKG